MILRTIKLKPDYFSYSLWESDSEGFVDNIDANTLPISDRLKQDINQWEENYEATYCADNPTESGLASHEVELVFW
ncbi:hypothetical protein HZU77_011800 [Neisseriaceae bacterium TC5R-5]|nr:hypothetical protein [Neisseriaceae bacterium TC5R-5]